MYCRLVKVRWTFRFYPSEPQKRQLAREFGCARHAFNFALRLRTDSFKDGKPVNYNASSAAWTKHRNDPAFAFLRASSCIPQQQSLRHLQTAFANFFAKRSKYPRFRSKHGRQSAEYTTSGGFKWDSRNRNLRITKLGRLDVHWSREFTSNPTTATITKREDGRYFVSLCLDECAELPAKTGDSIGVDLGISRLATLSNGERIHNPKHLGTNLVKLARQQRILSRRKKGSGRWNRQRLKVARLHSHIANSRKDCLDKLTTGLVRRFDVLAIEDLNVRGMVKYHCLARAISDVGFGMFRQMLTYKAQWQGKELRVADRFFPSSKRCSACGFVHTEMPLSVREFTCQECGTQHDRDHNAAKNILQFAAGGQPVEARGENARPVPAKARKGSSRGTVKQPSSVDV